MKSNILTFLSLPILIISCCLPKNQKEDIDPDNAPDTLELFAEGIISTELNERDMAISPDGNDMFYSIFSYDNTVRVLMHCTKEGDSWSDPDPATFAGKYFDLEPAFSPDGSRLFFVSNRPLSPEDTTQDHNIWYVLRTDSGWINPQPLSTVINTEAEEFYPSVSSNGNLYFTARYADALGGEDIYFSRFEKGEYKKPERLDSAVNSASFEFNAYISPDEDILIYSSFGRPDGLGGGDLYVCIKDKENNWTPARNLGPTINSSRLDYCPFIDWPRTTFYFSSNRGPEPPEEIQSLQEFKELASGTLNGMGNIYRIQLSALDLKLEK